MSVQSYRIPRIQRGLVAISPGSLALKPVPVPRVAPDEVLVLVAAVALNPSDHKLLDQSTTVGAISGADFAGTVVRIGSGTSDDDKHDLKLGDRVLAFVFGANPGSPGNGAFAQYVTVPARLCIKIPDKSKYDFAAAASMAMGLATAGLIFRQLGLRLDLRDQDRKEQDVPTANEGDYVLVHGGATSTGTIMLQILRLAGYTPIATCSKSNQALVKSRGAVVSFDYNSPTIRDDIREYTSNGLRFAVDCFGTQETMTLCYGVLGHQEHQPGNHAVLRNKYIALEQYPRQLTIRRRDVAHEWILAWTVQGKEVKLAGAYYRPLGPEVRDDRMYGETWARKMEQLLEDGRLEPHPLEVCREGGLSAIVPKLDQLRKGVVRGKKLVFWT